MKKPLPRFLLLPVLMADTGTQLSLQTLIAEDTILALDCCPDSGDVQIRLDVNNPNTSVKKELAKLLGAPVPTEMLGVVSPAAFTDIGAAIAGDFVTFEIAQRRRAESYEHTHMLMTRLTQIKRVREGNYPNTVNVDLLDDGSNAVEAIVPFEEAVSWLHQRRPVEPIGFHTGDAPPVLTYKTFGLKQNKGILMDSAIPLDDLFMLISMDGADVEEALQHAALKDAPSAIAVGRVGGLLGDAIVGRTLSELAAELPEYTLIPAQIRRQDSAIDSPSLINPFGCATIAYDHENGLTQAQDRGGNTVTVTDPVGDFFRACMEALNPVIVKTPQMA